MTPQSLSATGVLVVTAVFIPASAQLRVALLTPPVLAFRLSRAISSW